MTQLTEDGTALPRRMVLALAITTLALAQATPSQGAAPALVDLQVIDRETGRPARVWSQAGRLYVAGQPGARYSLRVTNNTAGRVLVVMSVDGVNILTGETAAFGQRGYVFSPYETYDVSGWRKSDTEVAAFTFAPLSRSYAARTGRPNDVGVIGVAAFTERYVPPPPPPRPYVPSVSPESRESGAAEDVVVTGALRAAPTAPPPALAAPPPQAQRRAEKLGTGHGAREWSSVTTVAFERASPYPQQVSRIEYDSAENLIAMGVIPRPQPASRGPRPFPSSPDRHGYVPDPPHGR